MKKILFRFSLLFFLGGCISAQPPKRPLDYPYSFIFEGTFNDVWRATVNVLDIYSITVANREAGLLQTDWMNYRSNPELYDHPDIKQHLEEVRYRLKIKLSKAVITETNMPAVRVQVTKELEEYKNFFSDWERVPTDGLEEQIILYRVKQRLRIIDVKKRKSKGAQKS